MTGTPKIAQFHVSLPYPSNGIDTRVDLPFEADWVMLPQVYINDSNNSVVQQTFDTIGARVNDPSSPALPMTCQGDVQAGFSVGAIVGKIERLYMRALVALAPGTIDVVLWCGKDCDLGFNGEVFGSASNGNWG